MRGNIIMKCKPNKATEQSNNYDQLKLKNQLCFPVYAASRLITQAYTPHLDLLGISYPQYLVLLVLWESDGLSVNQIAQRLILDTNTVTPLLKRMETMGLVARQRSADDERRVAVVLTAKGKSLKEHAATIPQQLASHIVASGIDVATLVDLREKVGRLVDVLLKCRG